jgi:hypothetical protein
MSYKDLQDVFEALYGNVPKDFLKGYMSLLKAGNAAALSQQKSDLAYGRAVLAAATKRDQKFADRLINAYDDIAGPKALFERSEKREKEFEKQLGKLEKEQEDLNKIRGNYRDMSPADRKFIADAENLLGQNPNAFFDQAYAVSLTGTKKKPGEYVTSENPATYRVFQIATGAGDAYFADVVRKLDIDPTDLYELRTENPNEYEAKLDEYVEEAADDQAELSDAAAGRGKFPAIRDVVRDYYGNALKSYLNNELMVDELDRRLDTVRERVDAVQEGGGVRALAVAQIQSEAWNSVLDFAVQVDNRFDTREEVEKFLEKAGLPDQQEVITANVLAEGDPDKLAGVKDASLKGILDKFQSSMLNEYQRRVDPDTDQILKYLKYVDTLADNPRFQLYRQSRGITSTARPSFAETQKYRRDIERMGNPLTAPLYRHKRTGDVRRVEAIATELGYDTPVGMLFFADEGQYLTPQQVDAISAEDLKTAQFVEFDLSNETLRGRVFAAVADDEMRKALNVVENSEEGFKDRARMVYDKNSGKFAILDDQLRVRFQGGIAEDQQGAILIDATNPDFAEPAGSARGYQANQKKNALSQEEFDSIIAADRNEQVSALGAYLPVSRAKPARTTFFGELTYVPGQDPNEFYFLLEGADGRKQLRKIDGLNPSTKDRQIFSVVKIGTTEEDLKAYNDSTGANLNMRQFRRMTRPPLAGRGRTESRADRQARRARVKAGDTISKAETIEPIEFTKEEVAETPVETPAEDTAGKAPATGSADGRGVSSVSRALRAGAGAGAGVDILPTPEKIAMDIEAAGGGVAAPMSNPDLVPRPTVGDETVRGDETVKVAESVKAAKPAAPKPAEMSFKEGETVRQTGRFGRAIGETLASQALGEPGQEFPNLGASAVRFAGDIGERIGERAGEALRSAGAKVPVIGKERVTLTAPDGRSVRVATVPEMLDADAERLGKAADIVPTIESPGETINRAITGTVTDIAKSAGGGLVDAFQYLRDIKVDVGDSPSRDDKKKEDARDEEEPKDDRDDDENDANALALAQG